jgi:hypothetical protein
MLSGMAGAAVTLKPQIEASATTTRLAAACSFLSHIKIREIMSLDAILSLSHLIFLAPANRISHVAVYPNLRFLCAH